MIANFIIYLLTKNKNGYIFMYITIIKTMVKHMEKYSFEFINERK